MPELEPSVVLAAPSSAPAEIGHVALAGLGGDERFAKPDWNRITDQVACPLCGYDLRGLTDPRCPECGYVFAWPELLDPARRKHPYLFEHHPRRNLWSFRRTVIGTLRPRRFWRDLYPTQPSSPRRLAVYAVLAAPLLLLSAIGPATTLVTARIRDTRAARASLVSYVNRSRGTMMIGVVSSGLPPGTAWTGPISRQQMISSHGSVEAYAAARYPIDWRDLLHNSLDVIRAGAPVQVLLLAWPVLTFLALMIFRTSMRRANIRTVHVLRCVVYSFDALFWLGLLWLLSSFVAAGLLLHQTRLPAVLQLLPDAIILFVVLAILHRLVLAYRLYLRFDHPIATVLASQVIVILSMALALLQLYNARLGLWI